MRIESYIRDQAFKLGFCAAGFAVPGPCKSFDRFQKWLKSGFAGEMKYLSRHTAQRANPLQMTPEAKTVIVVGARYPSGRTVGHISNYARLKDYHEVLKLKLDALKTFIARKTNQILSARVCVDSAPVLEREWAMRAGLGWIGKQGNLVNPECGCCMFLGELFLNIELEPSSPVANQCGRCRLCLDACPTGAIRPGGMLDARRCISYLTIEHKGEIPEELRPLIGSSLFGCDRCTAICPYNQGKPMPELAQEIQNMPGPEECLVMSKAQFKQRLVHTPVARTGLERLQRNAAIVLGNERSPAGRRVLEACLKNLSPLVRIHAVWALKRLKEIAR